LMLPEHLSVRWHAARRLAYWHRKVTQPLKAQQTFPVALRSMPVSTSTALLWYIARANVPVWFSPEYLFDLIFR
jgi:hypothetical protein